MKIEKVEAFPIRVKSEEVLRGGTFAYGDFQATLVKVTCDGEVGWGEAMSRSDPNINALLVKHLAKGMPMEVDAPAAAWSKAWSDLRVRGHTRGPTVEALSGIEMALQDCFGRLNRTPLGKMFSDSSKDRVKVFAGSIFESRGPLDRQVELAKEKGLSGAKVKVGFGAGKDAELLGEVRRSWPDGMLVADANGAYDSSAAVKACSAFERIGLAWFEEPVPSDDWEGYTKLKGSRVRIGAGETWFVSDFDVPIRDGLVGVLEPSVSRSGGVGLEMELAERAASKGIGFSPMTGMNSGLSLAASLQVASARATEGVEFNPFPNPLQTELVDGLEEPAEGVVRVPRGPGLGVEVDIRYVSKHLA